MKIAAARVKELAAMKRIDFANLFPQLNGGAYAQKKEVIMVVTTIKMTPNWVVNLP